MRHASKIRRIYDRLLDRYGPRGWWPILSRAGRRGFDARGYHPGDFRPPRTRRERFEVAVGAVLAQNTAWTNAERSLRQLLDRDLLDLDGLRGLPPGELAGLIRPSRYFREKTKKLKALAEFLASGTAVTRESLLGVWGVGPETADSILLYAYHEPYFVVDAYTMRFLAQAGILGEDATYAEVQELFHAALEPDVALFNEYHALLVEHGQAFYARRPYGRGDPLLPRRRGGASRSSSRRSRT